MPAAPHPSLSRCPECRYSLRELPAPHRCPECGYHYDEDTRVWRPRKPTAVFGGLIGYAAGILPMGNAVLNTGWPWPTVWFLAFLLWVGVGVYLVFLCMRLYRTGQYVSVGPEGVHIRMDQVATRLVPWSEITGVKTARYDRVCRLVHTTDGQVQVGGVFVSKDDVLEFAALVERYLQRHAS